MIYNSLLDAIGHTPLVRIDLGLPITMYTKLEYLNPGGSVKDRSALYMIEKAEQEGLLKKGGVIIEASSGNQGIAAAMIGAAKGYHVIITVSEKASSEKVNTIRAYGAEIVTCPVTDFVEDPRSYQQTAKRIHVNTPNSFMLNQYYNTNNRDAHYYSLGPELWQQTNGRITHFIAGAGSGGTISGVGRYLKEQNPAIKIFAVDSCNSKRATNGNPQPYQLEGLGIDIDPSPVVDYGIIDQFITVSDHDALAVLKTVARKGFLVGPTSGAVAWAATSIAQTLPSDAMLVMVFGDSGRAYLTKGFYNQKETKGTCAVTLNNIIDNTMVIE